ncbi:hypothetical protein GPY23_19805 [Photorhabdus bodei]|uniref:Uncharacterized protein n=2 Tax=Photorhabdus bodei TaxID=2029681 RepID=A0ABX0AQQ3_9GAMM|nr:hypothetical protein [Photorhabdus bodei]NDL05396.1 hypothetical protein [Photorhabdus bodei]NDL09691.1 hypothetical protein [Photorhabdus bodei]
MQQINNVLANSSVIAEDKLTVMMMFCFQLLSSTNADRVNMRISDGRVLTLKFEENFINH